MFSRNLTEKEIEMIGIIEGFVREKHAHNIGHDYSHIIEVTLRAIGIAQMLPEPVDPFILICGALFHDYYPSYSYFSYTARNNGGEDCL